MRGDLSSDIALQRSFVRRGERGALGALLESYGPRLYGYLVRVTGDSALARQGFLHIARRLAEAPYGGNRRLFVGWLFGLAVEAARKVSSSRTSLEQEREESRARRVIRDLSAELREAFLLSHYAQLLPEEVALALKIPTETAISRVERAVAEVRRALEAEKERGEDVSSR